LQARKLVVKLDPSERSCAQWRHFRIESAIGFDGAAGAGAFSA
jgi:hypothetical protein